MAREKGGGGELLGATPSAIDTERSSSRSRIRKGSVRDIPVATAAEGLGSQLQLQQSANGEQQPLTLTVPGQPAAIERSESPRLSPRTSPIGSPSHASIQMDECRSRIHSVRSFQSTKKGVLSKGDSILSDCSFASSVPTGDTSLAGESSSSPPSAASGAHPRGERMLSASVRDRETLSATADRSRRPPLRTSYTLGGEPSGPGSGVGGASQPSGLQTSWPASCSTSRQQSVCDRDEAEHKFYVQVVGASGVGKSSLTRLFLSSKCTAFNDTGVHCRLYCCCFNDEVAMCVFLCV